MSRSALVTGASSGIGAAFARALAARGWAVQLVGRDDTRLAAVRSALPGGDHRVVATDLRSEDGARRVLDLLADDEHPVSLLVAAAGVGAAVPFPRAPLEVELEQLRVNVTTVLAQLHVAARHMAARHDGGIITVSSTAAFWSAGTYAASKSWVLQATLGLHDQVKDDGVRVTAVCPGFTRTGFHATGGVDATGVRPFLWLSADEVAREGLAALDAGRAVCIPGTRYRTLVGLVRHLPAGGRRRVLRALAPLRPEPGSAD